MADTFLQKCKKCGLETDCIYDLCENCAYSPLSDSGKFIEECINEMKKEFVVKNKPFWIASNITTHILEDFIRQKLEQAIDFGWTEHEKEWKNELEEVRREAIQMTKDKLTLEKKESIFTIGEHQEYDAILEQGFNQAVDELENLKKEL